MDWSRLGGVAFDALLIAVTVGAVLSPPDPFSQLLYAGPAFVVALPVVYRYGRRSIVPWWRRYLVFAGGVLAVVLAWRALAFAIGFAVPPDVRLAFVLAGVLFGAWLAFFGGLERLRGEPSEA